MTLTESMVEEAAIGRFQALGYALLPGLQLSPGEPAAERESFSDVLLLGRLRQAIGRLNPTIPKEAREEALRKLLRLGTPSLTQTNRSFHQVLRDGVPVEYPRPDGSIAGSHGLRLQGKDDDIRHTASLSLSDEALRLEP
jgi:type I restriction enzyme R subunit